MNGIFILIVKRIALGLVSIIVISMLIFMGVEALPGDVAEAILLSEELGYYSSIPHALK